MNDPNYLDVNAFVDTLDDFNDFGVFGDVQAEIDFTELGIESEEEES